jgi:outer membrane protein TolC
MSRPSFAFFSAISSLFLAFLAVPVNSSAQVTGTGGPNTMTLEQVIEAANANYPAIKAAEAQQRAARGGIAVAKTAYLPHTDLLWQTNRATANNILGLLLPQSTIPSVTGSVLPSDPRRICLVLLRVSLPLYQRDRER